MVEFQGYITYLKSMLVKALAVTFDVNYPNEDFRGPDRFRASMEYPIEEAHYPGVWVDYDDADDLRIAGVDHEEFMPWEDNFIPITRWQFSGYVTYTVTALTSLERDRLYDELIATIAFGKYDPVRKRFREYIESNPLVACNFNWDVISPKASVAAPGTPWGTDEVIYERSLSIGLLGEFVPNPTTGALVPLGSITVTPIVVTDPADDGKIPLDPDTVGVGVYDWH